MRNKIVENVKGVTLIALVVTIIVLLILAGIAINLTIGNNGLFGRAENAANQWKRAEINEQEEMSNFESLYDNTLKNLGLDVEGNKPKENPLTKITGNETEKTDTTDKEGNRVVVPAGFKVINPEATVDEGIVIEDVSAKDGTTVGNQFVWIPCTVDGANNTIKYDRYAFTRDGWSRKQIKLEEKTEDGSYKIQREDQPSYYFYESMPELERESIEKYKGFYIGRYEVGCEGERNESSKGNINEVGKIQANLNVYNYVTSEEAETIATKMYEEKGIITRLCSSYAWDTTLKFIDGKEGSYSVNSIGENYSGELQKTGYHEIKNIYDIGGNVGKWTTEKSNYYNNSYVGRGGYCKSEAIEYPAADRDYTYIGAAGISVALRVTLYI